MDGPAGTELAGHCLVLDKISHRWAGSGADSYSPGEVTPKHGGTSPLDCPSHQRDAACYTPEYPSGPESLDLRGVVVHIHYESGTSAYVCSGAMVNQRVPVARLRYLLLTAHHCIGTREEADSIESVHYFVASQCGGSVADNRAFATYGGADYLAGLHSADQTLVELRGPFFGAVWLSGWDASDSAPYGDSYSPEVYGIHHPAGYQMAYSRGYARQRRDIEVMDYGRVLEAIPVDYVLGTVERGSSGSGLFYDDEEGYLVGVLSGGRGCDDPGYYGSFRDFFPVIRAHIDPGGTEDPFTVVGRIPYFPRDRLSSQQGFLRVNNLTSREARVIVRASRETSPTFVDACEFRVPAYGANALNSEHLEAGDAGRGCIGIGRGNGDWTLEIRSDVPNLGVNAYARALDGTGFLNSLTGVAEGIESEEGGHFYYLPFINPASNLSSISRVRITNRGPAPARDVQLFGFDGQGREFPTTGATYLAGALPSNHTVSFTSQELESGAPGKFSGTVFGDGSGKWTLWVFSPDAPLEVVGLMSSQGLTSNLSR